MTPDELSAIYDMCADVTTTETTIGFALFSIVVMAIGAMAGYFANE